MAISRPMGFVEHCFARFSHSFRHHFTSLRPSPRHVPPDLSSPSPLHYALSPSPLLVLSFSPVILLHPSPVMSGSRSGITSFVPTNRCVHEYASEDAGTGYDAHDPRNKRRTCAATCPILAWGKDCRTQRFVGTNLINPVALKWLSMKQMMPRLYPFLDIGKGFFY